MNKFENNFPSENKFEAKPETDETSEDLNSQDLEGNKDLTLKLAADKLVSDKIAEKIQSEISEEKNPENENKAIERAAAEKRRQEYIQAGFDLIISDLESTRDEKGFLDLFLTKKFKEDHKNEIQEKINNVKSLKNSNLNATKISWEVILVKAKFNSNKIRKQLEGLKTEYGLTQQDKEAMTASKKTLDQVQNEAVKIA